MSKSAMHREAFGGEQFVKIIDAGLGLLLALLLIVLAVAVVAWDEGPGLSGLVWGYVTRRGRAD
jgi:hypothetical protein